ncbi:hydroxymethylglutaryl-CoA lyase [Paracoccus isoporae]|uniref:Hydroxymethylglutaryl-CoA lyase n=1 Tax=Paracoccus isoporae TaxID=591205 RepID=A0A1G6ZNL6_9RHOB|nr:hydroxymethylglutaryl-CoA lyase [Paracoccus isoporae]SDE03445.1 hydroxymethylglutaryl-CoA lyase [Paracoccus isoporae]
MIALCDVGPRDGLQTLPRIFSLDEKRHVVTELVAAGLRHIEAVSMVNPQRVPQMAGAEELLESLPDMPGVTLSALALNRKGVERALATRVDEIRFVVLASDSFSRRNQNMDSADSLAQFAAIAPIVKQAGRRIVGIIATAYGCPFEGEMSARRVAALADAMIAAGADQILFADTIGVAAPADILRVDRACRDVLDGVPWGVHLHNTRSTGYASLFAALERGATIVDAAIGGLGGCPFAPRATGNIATEDVHYMLDRQGVATGLDHDRLSALVAWLAERVPDQITGQLARAGWFPVRD